MTLSIKLSSLPMSAEEFAHRVAAHVERLREYYTHLHFAALDALDRNLKPHEKRVAFPAPSEEPLIEAAIRKNLGEDLSKADIAADYELTGPTLEEKKAALFAKIREMETAALHEVMPPHKARHWHFREQDIQAKRAAEWAKEQPTITVGDEDDLFMQDMANRHAKQQQVVRWSAKHEHDIGDLTEETVDHYEIGKTFA